MKVYDIAAKIENLAPLSLACDWDNPGLLVGDGNKEVKRAFITLDVNPFTVNEAVKCGADIIISHHPMFFRGIKKIDFSTFSGKMIKMLIENDISVYAAHTNMDIAKGGINDRLCEILGLSDTEILEDDGLGRVGKLYKEMNFDEFCHLVSKKLNTPLKICGDRDRIIKKAAVASGSCSEVIPTAILKGCDAIVTSDLKYHESMDAVFGGINLIDAGHYPTEICVMKIFADILKDCGIDIVFSKNKDVFEFLI